MNYSLHTRLSSNTRTNDADRGRLEKSPRNGGNLLGKPVYSNAQKDLTYYREISPNRHLYLVTQDKYGNLTKK